VAKGTEKLYQAIQPSEDAFGGSLGDNDPIMKQVQEKSLSFFDWLDLNLPKQKGKGFYEWLNSYL